MPLIINSGRAVFRLSFTFDSFIFLLLLPCHHLLCLHCVSWDLYTCPLQSSWLPIAACMSKCIALQCSLHSFWSASLCMAPHCSKFNCSKALMLNKGLFVQSFSHMLASCCNDNPFKSEMEPLDTSVVVSRTQRNSLFLLAGDYWQVKDLSFSVSERGSKTYPSFQL